MSPHWASVVQGPEQKSLRPASRQTPVTQSCAPATEQSSPEPAQARLAGAALGHAVAALGPLGSVTGLHTKPAPKLRTQAASSAQGVEQNDSPAKGQLVQLFTMQRFSAKPPRRQSSLSTQGEHMRPSEAPVHTLLVHTLPRPHWLSWPMVSVESQ